MSGGRRGSKKKYLNIARSFPISPSLYEAQLFVETGFPIAENPAAMEEQKKPAQSSAHHPMVEKEEFKEKNNICEECSKEDKSVIHNLILTGFKICDSCKLSKSIFPV